MKHETK